jgi:hypothetical protein
MLDRAVFRHGDRTKRKPRVDRDDAPEWTNEMVARAEISEGHRIIRRGRPPLGDKAKGV